MKVQRSGVVPTFQAARSNTSQLLVFIHQQNSNGLALAVRLSRQPLGNGNAGDASSHYQHIAVSDLNLLHGVVTRKPRRRAALFRSAASGSIGSGAGSVLSGRSPRGSSSSLVAPFFSIQPLTSEA